MRIWGVAKRLVMSRKAKRAEVVEQSAHWFLVTADGGCATFPIMVGVLADKQGFGRKLYICAVIIQADAPVDVQDLQDGQLLPMRIFVYCDTPPAG